MKNVIKKLIYALLVLGLLVALWFLFKQLSSLKKTDNGQPAQNTRALYISPPPNSLLQPGAAQKFEIRFSNSLTGSATKAVLLVSSAKTPESKNTVRVSQNTTGNLMVITTEEPIMPVSLYTLTITQNNQPLLTASFTSDMTRPTPIPVNNSALQDYLPYTASGFTLRYLESRNIYIANIKYDKNSSLSLSAQIDQVKKDVAQFVQSKRISLDSVKIEYSLK